VPRVSPLNSQVAFRSQVSGFFFDIANASKGFHGSCLDRVSFPVRVLTLLRLSTFFHLADFDFLEDARVTRPC
jgi:hypothetical protein